MAWATIRKASAEDYEKLEKRAAAFCKRHDLVQEMGDETAVETVENWIAFHLEGYGKSLEEIQEARKLRRAWLGVVRRALGHPWAEGIGYGYVGYAEEA